MSGPKKPGNFKTYADFSHYILECAIHDRQWYCTCISPKYAWDWTPEIEAQVKEVSDEIRCMYNRLRALERRRDESA